MLRHRLITKIWPLTLAAALLAPLAASAQTAPTPAPPAAPAAPAAPGAPMAPRNANRLNGKITAVDAAAKTVTIRSRRMPVTVSVPDGIKIYKVGDAKGSPTGAFADLTVDTRIAVRTNGDADKPVASEIHIQPARNAAPPAAPAPPPAAPAPPVAPTP